VFIWKLGTSPDLNKPLAFLAVDDISFDWCQDNRHIFVYGGGDVFFGSTNNLVQLPRAASKIQGITQLIDPQTKELNELVILGERHLSSIWRRRSFWNYTYSTDVWPALAKPQ
jgi:hypothetical protein